MIPVYGRSPQQIAEDALIAMCTPVYNASRADCARFAIQFREVARDTRQKAEQLFEEWEASSAQINSVMRLWPVWSYITARARY